MCDSAISMVESYRKYLDDASAMDGDLVVEKFAKQLQNLDKPWLVFFDDVNNLDDFKRLGPLRLQLGEGFGSFLVTTRLMPEVLPIPKPAAKYNAIRIQPMEKYEAMDLFLKALGPNEKYDLSDLSDWIGRLAGIPLALHMLAAALRNGNMSREAISEQLSPLTHYYEDYEEDPASVWTDVLQSLSSLARGQLAYLACFDPDRISMELVEEYERRAPSPISARNAREQLIQSSLIRCAHETQDITMHRLTRHTVLEELRTQNRLEFVATLAMDILASHYEAAAADDDMGDPLALDPYARHVEAVMGLESVTPYRSVKAKLAKARLLGVIGGFHSRHRNPGSAEKALLTSLEVYETLPGTERQQLQLVRRLAATHRIEGKRIEALKLEAELCRRLGLRERGDKNGRNETAIDDDVETLSNSHPSSSSPTSDEDEEQEEDKADIESVLSNFLPSLTTGSTISSSLDPGLIEDIKSDVLTILIKDKDLRTLLEETPRRITHDRFQRNFLRLFRSFLSDIREQSNSEEHNQELHQVVRVLRYQSRNIASHICQEIFDLKAQSEALSSLALQVPDKDRHLVSFLDNNRQVLTK